jgi:hypothetical protein
MFLICLNTEFHMASHNDSFYIKVKSTCGKNVIGLHSTSCMFFKDLLLHQISGPYIKWYKHCSHLRSLHNYQAHITDGRKRKSIKVSSGMQFISNFMKTHSLVQKLFSGDRHTDTITLLTGLSYKENTLNVMNLNLLSLSLGWCICSCGFLTLPNNLFFT